MSPSVYQLANADAPAVYQLSPMPAAVARPLPLPLPLPLPVRVFRPGPIPARGGEWHTISINGFPATLRVWLPGPEDDDAPNDAIKFSGGILVTMRVDD